MKLARFASISLVVLLAACGGGGTTTPPDTPPTTPPGEAPTDVELAGAWTGTTNTPTYGTEQTTFIFTQDGSSIGGTLTLVGSVPADPNNAVTGTLSGNTATVSSTYKLINNGVDTGNTLEYRYQGTVSGTSFSGTITLLANGTEQEEGQFSVTKGGSPGNPTVPPTNDTPFYGEWAWSFDRTSDFDFHYEGRYSIVQTRPGDPEGTGFGFYQQCYDGTCYDQIEGGVTMGPGEDNTLMITLFQVNSAGDPVIVYEAVDSDGKLEKDEQGRDVFEGRGTIFENNDRATGNFKAILTTFPIAFPPTN